LVELGALRTIRRASRPVKTLHIAYWVTDLAVSLDF